jgi:hypothetical protein
MSLTTRERFGGVAVVCVGFLMVAGCGGGGSATTSGQQPLSQQEFVAQANAACKQANGELRALQAPTDLPSFASFTAQSEPVAKNLYSKLSALAPPANLQAQWSQIITDFHTALAKLADIRTAAEAGDAQKVQSIANDIQALSDDPQARDMGLDECAKDVQPQG